MEKVTIVIPNFNGERYLKDCLEHLRPSYQRGNVSYRVLVVDNGSEDGSRQILEQEFPWVQRIYLKTNTGFCKAVNVGIRETKSPFVILLNNDTKAEPGFVESLYRAIEPHQRCFSVSGAMLMWDRPELLDDAGDFYCAFGWSRAIGHGEPAADHTRPARVFSACAGAAIYRMSALEQIGLFDEAHFAYLEDLDIGYRARLYGYYNAYEPAARVLHFGSASTGSRYNLRKTELSSRNNAYVVLKNMPLLQLFINLPFLLAGFAIKTVFFARKGMGKEYVLGYLKGIKMGCSARGREHHVPFELKRLPYYLAVQGLLWKNLVLLRRN
ncbi:MAG: glycosyltransferase family 2 protein [Lachnospiraceae bacterium]|nr:glycosyltransferase family 2 protein [Lachnospiraceae bacterium]